MGAFYHFQQYILRLSSTCLAYVNLFHFWTTQFPNTEFYVCTERNLLPLDYKLLLKFKVTLAVLDFPAPWNSTSPYAFVSQSFTSLVFQGSCFVLLLVLSVFSWSAFSQPHWHLWKKWSIKKYLNSNKSVSFVRIKFRKTRIKSK